MVIDELYRDYFQKSKIFVYPLLGIKRGSAAVPEQTYLSWQGKIKTEDKKLITVYEARKDAEYMLFEKNIILKHPKIIDVLRIKENKKVFVFDFSDLEDNWNYIIYGKYSMISDNIKHKLLNHFDKYSGNRNYLETYLYPEKYFDVYSELLDAKESLLKSVGELCTPPDLDKENLIAKILDLDNKKILG
jgi:hypothetical protein